MNTVKIQSTHLSRQAVVYPRQSTMKQLHEHKESTMRQYALKTRAAELGWAEQQIVVINDDLGQSGASGEWRLGFQRLAENVAHGRVGGIFALEVSRLARSSADWHRLLELCALADVVIADEQAVYTPRDYNDRLLLGLKGTMSEAELYWMRLRLDGGRVSKARRGEYHFCPPAGYEWDSDAQTFRFDSSLEVQQAIALVFERFRIDGSAYGVSRYLGRMKLLLPCRDIQTKTVRWVQPRHTLILHMLHNPIFAGSYAYGRSEERMGLVAGRLKRRKKRSLMQDDWISLIHDHHPAYISWEEFMANEKKLTENRAHEFFGENRGAAREGKALLQGLALCGKCGHRMSVRYQGSAGHSQYMCRVNAPLLGSLCWDVAGKVIEEAVERLFLAAAVPSEVELALSVANETEQQINAVDRQWKLHRERLEYEARLAERRYKATDPDNRVVARTLEREWEEKLRYLEKAEEDHQKLCQKESLQLTDSDRTHLVEVSKNLPAVWKAKTTTHTERKNLLRTLIREVTLTPIEVPQRLTRIQVWWHSGAVSDIMVPRKDRYMTLATPDDIVEMIRKQFNEGADDGRIAELLNDKKKPRLSGRPWDPETVRHVRYNYGMHRETTRSRRAANRREDGLYSVHGVAEKLGVTPALVSNWASTGILPVAEGGGTTRARWFKLDDAILSRLQAAKAKRYRLEFYIENEQKP